MNKLLLSLSVLVSITMFSCGGGSVNPNEVAKTYLNAMNKADYEAAKKVSTKETQDFITTVAQFGAMAPDSVKKLSAAIKVETKGEAAIDGDNAVVTYTESDKPDTKTITLVKTDGKWLVKQSKDPAMPGADMKAANEADAAKEEAVDMAADTTKKTK